MLLELPGVVGVPTRTVFEIVAVGNFHESNTRLEKASRQKATLSEFAAVGSAQVGRFGFQVEGLHEFGSGKTDALLQGSVVFREFFILGESLLAPFPDFFQKLLPTRVPEGGKPFGSCQTGGAGL